MATPEDQHNLHSLKVPRLPLSTRRILTFQKQTDLPNGKQKRHKTTKTTKETQTTSRQTAREQLKTFLTRLPHSTTLLQKQQHIIIG